MHLAEAMLPASHCLAWAAAATPSLLAGLGRLRPAPPEAQLTGSPQQRLHLAAAGGLLLLLTALKLPSVAGSSSHPTGLGLGTLLVGPPLMAPLVLCVLVLQALLMGHGGLTTLGANLFSLGVCGPWALWAVYRLGLRAGATSAAAAGVAASLSSLAVYGTTATQLALAYPAAGGFWPSCARFLLIYGYTQLPIALAEGVLTAYLVRRLPARETVR